MTINLMGLMPVFNDWQLKNGISNKAVWVKSILPTHKLTIPVTNIHTVSVQVLRDLIPSQDYLVTIFDAVDNTLIAYINNNSPNPQSFPESIIKKELLIQVQENTPPKLGIMRWPVITDVHTSLRFFLTEDDEGGIINLPVLTGIGKLSGFFDLSSLPDTVDYSQISIVANYKDPQEGVYNGLQAGKTTCNPDGSWAIEGLNEGHRYNVVMSIPTFNDITYSNKDTSDSTYVPVGDPYWKNVVALLHFDESLTKNEAGSNFLVYGNPQLVEGKFGDALYGDGSHGVIGEGIDFILGSQDFTIECFWKPVGINRTAFSFNAHGSTAHTVYQFNQGLSFWNGGSNLIISNVIVPSSDFSHIAFVRRNSVALLFLNGILVGSAPYALELNNNNLRTGNVTPTNPAGGAIDEFRVTKGVARYTENFTPPTEPFLNHLPR